MTAARESDLCDEGGNRHTWDDKRPLTIDAQGRLVAVRSCLRCPRQEWKGYGGRTPRSWTMFEPEVEAEL